ncbi:gamma-glutamylcyclotransferase [Caenimonas sedimenti]|uniref:Gamma-glutamylcyclotransferase n=1 Tax=Caenimonas sedimenti TaxID=2596921 RepID=A0A562ZWY1_9BURK|nr:gamma-glutamylcyclotransferase family protein [Caenimonas sedimenti]TWO72805.1 gamma-glutamylcyclotransferase [Caenimonas sedimenti]
MPEADPQPHPADSLRESDGARRHVFVYGTLRRGGRNDINRLEPAPDYVGMGEVQGILYHIDWYPGLTLGGEEAVTVVGEVYRVTPELEQVLDGIEQIVPGPESEYFKREVPVSVQGRPIRCLVYEINAARARGKQSIGHGDWILFHQP